MIVLIPDCVFFLLNPYLIQYLRYCHIAKRIPTVAGTLLSLNVRHKGKPTFLFFQMKKRRFYSTIIISLFSEDNFFSFSVAISGLSVTT